ncbi:hypothetical protein K8I85_14380, partial [bacterium]|nr:hypothetical protein [bacterium]
RVCDALVKALEARGHAVTVGGEGAGTAAVVFDERIPIGLEEGVRSVSEEKAAELGRRYWPRMVEPAGRLVLRIDALSSIGPARRTWADGKRQRVEDCLGDFVVTLEALAPALRDWRENLESQRREHGLAMERRLDEQRRRERLLQELDAWRQASDIRRYLRALEQASSDDEDRELRARIAWGLGYADRIDPTSRKASAGP